MMFAKSTVNKALSCASRASFGTCRAQSCWALLLALILAGCAKEISDIEHVQNARQFQDQSQWRAALIEYKNALQKNPRNIEARWLLGNLFLDAGDGAAAEKELRHASEPDEMRAQTAAPIARSLLLQKRYDDLLKEFSPPAFSEQYVTAELLGVMAEAYASNALFDQAKNAINRAIAMDGAALPVMLSAARIAVAHGLSSEAIEWVNRVLERAPDDPSAWLLKGDLSYIASQLHDAELAYQKALDNDQRQLVTQRNIRARIGMVFTLLAQDKQDAALPHIDVLLKVNSKHFLANYLRGLAAFKKADFTTALDFLQRSIQTAPVNSPAFALLGAVNYEMGNLQQSELYLGKYLAAAPDDLVARKLLGAVRLKLNQPGKAMEVLSGAGSVGDGDAQLLTLMGEAAARSGDFREGREYFQKAMKSTSNSSELQTQIAQTFMAEGEYDRAIVQLQQAARHTGTSRQAKILEVIAYLKKNDGVAALQAAKAFVAEQPKDPEMQNILGGVLLAQKNAQGAREQFEKALSIQPKFIPALQNLASLDFHEKKYSNARAGYLKILEIESGNTVAMVSLSRVEAAENRQAAAIEWLEKARISNKFALEPRLLLARYFFGRGDLEKAESVAQEGVDSHALNYTALATLGEIQMARKQYNRAAATYETLVKLNPKDGVALFHLGQARASMNQFDLARKHFRLALSVNSELFPAVAALAALEARASNIPAATLLADEYIRKHPKNADGYALRGDLLLAQGQFATADKAYAHALELQQTSTLVVKRFRALSQLESGGVDIELLQGWLVKHPKDNLVRLTLADAYQKLGRSTEAASAYQAMLAENPEQVVVLNNLALAYLSSRDPRAKNTAEKAHQLAADNPFVVDTLGWVLLELGELSRAKQLLEQAATKLPNHPDIQTHYAIALEKSGEKERAREILKRVLKGQRTFESRANAEQALEKLK